MDKIEVLARVLQARDRGLTMVFCQTKRAADQVAGALETRGFAVATVHGDLGQGQRERALRAFRSGKVDVLTATEVAARGLDVDDVTHVVNYECPDDDMTYVHRIGRTGRAGRTGVAVTFVDWRDMHRWKLINDALNLGKPEPEETYSTSEHLYAQLDIPREATGTLPRAMRAREGLAAEALEDIGETGKIRSSGGDPRRTRDSAASGSGRSGARPGGQARGGSGQPRKSSAAAVHKDGGQAAGGTAKPRRRRRTRAGRDLAAGAAGAGQAGAGQAGATGAGQAEKTSLDGGQPAKRLGRRRRAARAENSSEETRKAS
jgi:superfamily II DNA/RNA helicase